MFQRAWRRLWATPIFTVFSVVSLALGVGVTTAIYSVIVSVTRNAMVVPNEDRIGLIVGIDPVDGRRLTWRSVVSRADFEDLARAGTSIGQLAASAGFYQSVVSGSVSDVAPGEAVTGSYFAMLGLTPHLGRLIQPSDDQSPARIVVLGYQFWRTHFLSDPHIVGKTVRIGGEPFEVAGVGPEAFGGLTDRIQTFTAVWVPLSCTTMFPSGAAPPKDPADRRRRQLSVLAALSPARPIEATSAEIGSIGARLDVDFPIDMRRGEDAPPQPQPRTWSVRTIREVAAATDSRMSTAETGVMAIVGLVLVVACTNLANLVLARGSSRRHELAVRRALGASRARLIMEQLAETGLLAAMGAGGAFVVTRLLMWWFTSASLPISQAMVVTLDPRLDTTTLLLAAGSVIASLVVFGLAPAVQLTRVQLRSALSTEGGSTGQLKWRTRRGLISVQVMISVSFFLISAFAVRIVLSERSRPSGIDVDRLAMGTFNFYLPPWNETSAREVVDRLMTLAPTQPGVESVAVVSGMPFGFPGTPIATVTAIDKPFLPGRENYPHAVLLAATPSIFTTLGVPVLKGRAFDGRDLIGGPAVAVLSSVTARQIFGTSDAVGRIILLRNAINMMDQTTVHTLTVIGVAGDTDTQQRRSHDTGTVYLPLAQHYEPGLVLLGRTSGDPADLVVPLKTLVQRADPDLVLDRPGTAAMKITGMYVLMDIVSRVAGGLAVLAMVLGMAGLSGVLTHVVSKRTREMGLRMALGAEPGQIRRLVMRDGLAPVGSGITMGLLIGGAVRLLMRSAYDSPWTSSDAIVFALAPVPIIVAALLACYWPARRASRVDPNVALRDL